MRQVALRPAYIAALAAFVLTAIIAHGRSTPYNNYVLLADAFVHGHAWIDWPGSYIDALPFAGKHYIIEAPLPALLLIPFVALWHTAVNQTLLALVLAAVAIGAAWELCERYGLNQQTTLWLCAFLLAGTDLLWCAMLGDVWFLAHVSAVCFTLLALVELAGKRRGWLVALWGICAAESRFTLVLALPVYAFMLIQNCDSQKNSELRDHHRQQNSELKPKENTKIKPGNTNLTVPWHRVGGFTGVLITCAALWVWYNYARWGTWYDIGYTAWYHQDPAGSPSGSPFQLQYFWYQLQSFFVQWPTFLPAYPWVRPEMTGVALTWTSPALLLVVLSLLPNRFRRESFPLWVAVVLTAAPNFVYYVNGFAQFGMRHALDFEPFAFALIALGVRAGMPWWGCASVAYSACVGLWGCWYWNAFFRQGN